MNRDDLIERLKKAIAKGDPVFPDMLEDCLAALSPVLPEDVRSICLQLEDMTDDAESIHAIASFALKRLSQSLSWEKNRVSEYAQMCLDRDKEIENLRVQLSVWRGER